MDKVYLYTFIDNDNVDSIYHLITNKDCKKLLNDIEHFYYDFEEFDTIESLVEFLKNNNVDKGLIDYVSEQEDIYDLTCSGISELTDSILEYLDVLVSFEQNTFYY